MPYIVLRVWKSRIKFGRRSHVQFEVITLICLTVVRAIANAQRPWVVCVGVYFPEVNPMEAGALVKLVSLLFRVRPGCPVLNANYSGHLIVHISS